MRRRCPACGRDPGDGSTCDECGAPVYRYAVESDEWDTANPDFDDAWDLDPEDLDFGDVDIPPPDPDVVPPPPVATPSLPPSGARPPVRRPVERPTQPVPASDQPARRPSGCRGCLVVVLIIAVVGGALAFFASLLVTEGTVDFETGEGASAGVDAGEPGECLDLVTDGTVVVDTVEVPCDEPHDAEAFHRILLPIGPFPGDAALADVDAACLERFPDYVGADYAVSEYWLDSLVPTEAGWSAGDREIVCLLVSGDGSPLMGSGYRSGR